MIRTLLTLFFLSPIPYNIVGPPFREDPFWFQELALDKGWTEYQIEQQCLYQDNLLNRFVNELSDQFWWLMRYFESYLETVSIEGLTYLHHFIEGDSYPYHQYQVERVMFHDMIRFMAIRIQPFLNVDPDERRILDSATLCHDPILIQILIDAGCKVEPHMSLNKDNTWEDEDGPAYFPIQFQPFTKDSFLHHGVVEILRSTPVVTSSYTDKERYWFLTSECYKPGKHYRWYENIRRIMEEIDSHGRMITPFINSDLESRD